MAIGSNDVDSHHGPSYAGEAEIQGHDFHDIELTVFDPCPAADSGWLLSQFWLNCLFLTHNQKLTWLVVFWSSTGHCGSVVWIIQNSEVRRCNSMKVMLLLSWCLMSSDVIWHIRDKLWPMPKHGSIRMVYACLAVTCHLHFWQNDRDFLRATVVTRGWNGYRNKSQHRKSTLEKKILPPFQQGFEPATFQSRVRRSNHWAIPAPMKVMVLTWMISVGDAVVQK